MKKTIIAVIAAAVLIVIIAALGIAVVPTGYSGVKVSFGQVNQVPLASGLHFKVPFMDSIVMVNNKQQDFNISSTIWGESMDKVQVYMSDITVTYQISPAKSAWIYSNVTDYVNNLLPQSIISSALKSSTVMLPAEKVTIRSALEPIALQSLQNSIDEKYGEGTVSIIRVVINDMNFEDSYNNAISEKTIAQQKYETAQIENKRTIEKAEADAQAAEIAAEGRANATVTEAKGQAEANRILAESITENTLKQSFYDAWNGELPKVITGNASVANITDVSEYIE